MQMLVVLSTSYDLADDVVVPLAVSVGDEPDTARVALL
jgi:hypothetical protein